MKTNNQNPLAMKGKLLLMMFLFFIQANKLHAANYYWVGNSGNWDDFANHWATTSGGTVFHTQPPTQNDDVNFDFNSFTVPNCTITFTNPAQCLSFYGFPNFNPSMSLAGGPLPHLTIYGSFICPAPFDIHFPIEFFNMSPGTFDIQTGMNQFAIQIYNPNGPSTYNLLSDFRGCLSVVSAKLNTNNYNIILSCNGFYIAQNAEVNFGTSTATNSALGLPELCGLTIDNTSTVNASQATINVTGDFIHTPGGTPLNIKSLTAGNIKCVGDTIGNATVTADYFNGGQNVINKLSFTNANYPLLTDSLTPVSDNIIDTLEFTGNGLIDPFSGNRNYINHVITSSGVEIKFGSDDTTYISTFDNYSNSITLSSSQTGQPSFLKFSGGQCFNAASIQDINASGTGSFYAGTAGVDLGGNTGWQFAACASAVGYYWVGGTGDWTDVSHWATTSGGTTFHTVPPGSNDDVYFDGNSFSGIGQVITINSPQAICKDFNWANSIPDSRVLSSTANNILNINGSIFIDNTADFDFNGKIILGAAFNSCTISIADTLFADLELYNNVGVWNLANNIISRNDIKLVAGFFYTNGYDVFCKALRAEIITTGLINLSTSTIYFIEFDNQNQNGYYGWNADSIVYVVADSATFVYQTLPVADVGYASGQYQFNSYSTNKYNKIIFNGNTSGASFPTNQSLNFGGTFFMNIGSIEANNVGVDLRNIKKLNIDTIIATALTTKNLYFYNNDTISIDYLLSNQDVNLNAGNAQFSKIIINNLEANNLNVFGANPNPTTLGNVVVIDNGNINNVIANNIILQGNGVIVYTETNTLSLAAGKDYTVEGLTVNSSFNAIGNASNFIQLHSAQLGLTAGVLFNQSVVCGDYLNIRDISVASANFYSGNNSVNLGGNSGIFFTSCPPPANAYYWVGGTGNWSDVSHWATTSGGTTFYASPPSPLDDVYFDTNSFNSINDTLYVLGANNYCNNFYSSGLLFPIVLSLDMLGDKIKCYSSITLDSNFQFPFGGQGSIEFYSQASGNTINFNQVEFAENKIDFTNASGQFTLLSDIVNQYGELKIANCSFFANSKKITSYYLFITPGVGDTVDLSNCKIQTDLFSVGNGDRINFSGSDIIASTQFTCWPTINGMVNLNSVKTITANLALTNVHNLTADFIFSTDYNNIDVLNMPFQASSTIDYNGSPALNIRKAIIDGSLQIAQSQGNGHLSFDTLFFANSTSIFSISGPDTISINSLWASGINSPNHLFIDGGNIFSSNPVCLNSVWLQNTHALGVSFSAGTGSIDLGGNTGWQFAPCTNVSNVWPGDANYDLAVNNNDVLNIGLAYSNTGPIRAGASLAYVAQPATDWNGFFQTAVNHKHADTNGDGMVNDDDTTAVSLNYGLTHPARMGSTANNSSALGIPLYVDVQPDSAALSDTVDIDVVLGTAAMPVDSIYGIAFTVNFDTTYVDTAYIASDYSLSWMGTTGVDLLCFDKKFAADGKIDVAITRTDQNNTNGFGSVARFTVVIVDNVSGRVSVPFTLSNVYAITADEYELVLDINADSISIDTTTSLTSLINLRGIHVYPNPAKDVLKIKSVGHEILYAELMDTFGRKLLSTDKIREGELTLPIHNLNNGVYILNVASNRGVIKKKIIKQ